MPWARDCASLLLAAFAAVLLAKHAEGAEAPPLQLEAKIALGDVRGRIDHMAVDFGTAPSVHRETFSALVGLIWQVSDKLSFDVAFRHALTNGHDVNEVRAGVTFAVPLRFEGARNR